MGREKSDGRVVPKGRRKATPIAQAQNLAGRQGKASTINEGVEQLQLNFETADNPQGNASDGDPGQPESTTSAEPKSKDTPSTTLPPMTMEEIAAEENLRRAWQHVASNQGAAGPDGQSIEEMREHLDQVLGTLHRTLLDGTYRPGLTRRVWIPKAGGGQRGLAFRT